MGFGGIKHMGESYEGADDSSSYMLLQKTRSEGFQGYTYSSILDIYLKNVADPIGYIVPPLSGKVIFERIDGTDKYNMVLDTSFFSRTRIN